MDDRALIDAYVEWAITRKGNERLTMYQYALKLHDFVRFIAPTSVLVADAELVDRWAQRRPLAASTRAKDKTILSGFFAWLIRRGYCKVDPTVELVAPKIRNQNPRPISDELWSAWYGARHRDDDVLLYMGLGYLAGLRRAEITRLTGEMVNGRSLVISGLRRKGGGDDVIAVRDLVEVVALGLPALLPDGGERFLSALAARARTRSVLFEWGASQRPEWRKPENVLAPGQVDQQWVYRRIARWARETRLEKWKPHDLRHSFVTNLLRCDVPLALVSRLANHSSFDVTSRYAKLGGSELRQFVRRQRDEQAERPVLTRFA